MTQQGESVVASVLGGRFVQQQFSLKFGNAVFEGLGVLGFDNQEQHFTSFWADTTGTRFQIMTGQLSDQTLEFLGQFSMPDGRVREVRSTFDIDESGFTYSWYEKNSDGAWQKHMEHTYSQK